MKDYSLDAYIFGCPILNAEARCKLEHMGMKVPEQCECEKKVECSPKHLIFAITEKFKKGVCIHGHFNKTRGFGVMDYYPEV